MRTKFAYQEPLSYCPSNSAQIVQDYVEKYKRLDALLQVNSAILDMAHEDLQRCLSSSKQGRRGDYTTDQICRSILVMFIEQWSYRKTVFEVECNEVFNRFARLGVMPMMDFTFLSRAFNAISEETWKRINQALGAYAHQEEKIDGEKLRVDSTVYEANIHYPTDSSLLWDSFRTLARLLKKMRKSLKAMGLAPRFHLKKVKKLAEFISRNGKSTSKRTQRKVTGTYRTLVERVQRIADLTRTVLEKWSGALEGRATQLAHYLPIVERIIHQTEKRVFEGIILPADEKVYSLFEEHTELLKRGKAGKPIEFGHKIVVAQNGEKFITHYEVLPQRKEDKELLDATLNAHKDLFGEAPRVLAADRGFYESRDQLERLQEEITTVSIAKKGKRTAAEEERESSSDFQEGQNFRAGSEGTISVLKRAFKLKRCLFKGFKNFAASVGCAVFCHNLVLLARL